MGAKNKRERGRTRIDSEVAYREWIALGPDRKMAQLKDVLAEKYGDSEVPAQQTIDRWRHRNGWDVRAAEEDRAAAKRAAQLDQERRAHAFSDAGQRFKELADTLTRRVEEAVDQIECKSPRDAERLVNTAVTLVKTAEVLTGGVSDRTEETVNTEDPDGTGAILKQKLRELRERSQGAGADTSADAAMDGGEAGEHGPH